MQPLFSFLEAVNRLPDEAKALILAKTRINHYPKGHLLFHQGQVCHYMYFMASGLARIFHRKDDKEVIDWLATSGNPFTAIDSFYSRRSSRYHYRYHFLCFHGGDFPITIPHEYEVY